MKMRDSDKQARAFIIERNGRLEEDCYETKI